VIPSAAYGPAPARPTCLGRLHPAIRFGVVVLLIIVAMASPWPVVVVLTLLAAAALGATGMGARTQLSQLRPWLPMALLALVVHTLTTTTGAPLGHPSWAGVAAGARALLRLAGSMALLAVYLRSGSLDDLVAGLGWWLRPFGKLGLPVEDLSLAVAVACGTVPQVVGEGRRLQAVAELRGHSAVGRDGVRRAHRQPPWNRWLDRTRLVVPLLESLGRRAETIELALRGRRPSLSTAGGPRPGEWAVFGTGVVATVGLLLLRKGH
jgi:energy-coupling factor transporter transmembrane protein EcfT